MCGIGGVIDRRGPTAIDELVTRMKAAIRHRGPDDEVVVSPDPTRHFFNVRLAIVDVAGGQQPLYNEDRTIGVVFNGEIYNHAALRDELSKRGHTFRTKTDGEVIAHLFEEKGVDGFTRLDGMFAFCLWTPKATYLVRDKLGIKPLYLHQQNGRLAFCSEVKGFVAAGLPLTVSAEGLRDYLVFRYVRGPHTIFKEVRKLEPGHFVIVQSGEVSARRYWDLPAFEPRLLRPDDARQQFRELLGQSVREQLMGEVPIGVLLSGGLDSSTVAYFLHEQGAHLKAFNIGFAEVNEFPFARDMAKKFDLDYHEFVLNDRDVVPTMERALAAVDEPLADPACIPLYKLAEQMKEHVTVVLSGEGSDEALGGYWQYAKTLAAHTQPDRAAHTTFLRESSYFAENLGLMFDRDERDDPFLPYFTRGPDLLSGMLAYDLKTWLPDDLLMKADKILMAHSLEGRFPFLSSKLIEFLCSVPSSMKLDERGTTKWLLRNLMSDLLPASIMERPKMGFTVPLDKLLHAAKPLVLDAVNSFSPLNEHIDHVRLVRLFNDYYAGRSQAALVSWSLASLHLWLNATLATARADAPASAALSAQSIEKRGLEFRSIDHCPLCGSTRTEPHLSIPDNACACELARCLDCDLVFQNPQLTVDGARQLEEGSAFYGTEVDIPQETQKRHGLIEDLERHAKKGNLLEIGCSTGFLLAAARERGWKVFGIELTERTGAFAKDKLGLPLFIGPIEQAPLEAGRFNMCVLWHTLEHAENPRLMIEVIRHALADDGVLAIQVPSLEYYVAFLRRSDLGTLVCLPHNFYFTVPVLKSLLERSGFMVEEIKAHDEMMLTAIARKSKKRLKPVTPAPTSRKATISEVPVAQPARENPVAVVRPASQKRSLAFIDREDNRYWWHKQPNSSFVPPIYKCLTDQEWAIMDAWFRDTDARKMHGEANISALSLLQGFVMGSIIGNMVQLGAYAGYSTLLVGFMMRSMGLKRSLFAVDIDPTLCSYCEEWVRRAELQDYVSIVRADSATKDLPAHARRYFSSDINLVFIDSSHQYAHTQRELYLWFEALAPGGFVFLHDSSDFAASFDEKGEGGVHRAFAEWKAKNPTIPAMSINDRMKGQPLLYKDGCGFGIIQKAG